MAQYVKSDRFDILRYYEMAAIQESHGAGAQSIAKRLPLTAVMTQSVPRLAAHTSRFLAVSRSVAQRVAEVGITAPAAGVKYCASNSLHTSA